MLRQLIYTASDPTDWRSHHAVYVLVSFTVPEPVTCCFNPTVPDVIQLKKSKGVFTSPNFPRHYGTNQYRLWRLQVSSDSCIKLYFEHFELRTCSNSRSCECDFIRFGEGHNVSVAPYGRFCGQSVTPTFTSKGSKVWVEFVSDSNLTSIGFQAMYQETTCASPSNTSQNSGML